MSLVKTIGALFLKPHFVVALAIICRLTLSHWLAKILFCLVAYDLWLAFITQPRKIRDPDRWSVVVIGAGFAGIGMGKRLIDAGINNFVILEKSPDVGGTWHDNKYPGIACDIPSHLYSYSFNLNSWCVQYSKDDIPFLVMYGSSDRWSESYSGGQEIQNYLRQTASYFGVLPHVQCNQEVILTTWDKTKKKWVIKTKSGGLFEANFCIRAAGALTEPKHVEIKNSDSFKGSMAHTRLWDKNLDLNDKRVAVIGELLNFGSPAEML